MSLGWLSSRHLHQFCTCIFSQLVKQVINKFIASLYCSACSTPFSRGIGICENKKYRGVYVRYMPRASCPGCSGGVEDKKGDLAIRLWNLIICIENVDAKCWLAEMTLVITSLPLGTCTFELVSPSRWFGGNVTAQQTGRATGELDVEFKFEICSRKLHLPFPPRRQSAPESLLAG